MSQFAQKLSLFVVALAACLAIQPDAIALNTWTNPDGSGSPITLTYSYQNMFEDDNPATSEIVDDNGVPLPDKLIRESIEEALGVWASVVPVHYVEVPDNGLNYGPAGVVGQIRFRHARIDGPDPPTGDPKPKARAGFPGTSNTAGDITYDHLDPWQEAGTIRVPDILGATIHELGHTLGLAAHSDNPDANMYWIFTRYPGLGTGALHPEDRSRIQALFGAGVGSVTPLPAGVRQDKPILPAVAEDGSFVFDQVTDTQWIAAPHAPRFTLTAQSGTAFTGIKKFPAGYADDFVVWVDGRPIGQYRPGQSVNFQIILGNSITEFSISGIHATFGRNLLEFPLLLDFESSSGSFAMTAIPEPATWAAILIALAALAAHLRRRRFRV